MGYAESSRAAQDLGCPRVTRWVLRWLSVVDNHGPSRNWLCQVEGSTVEGGRGGGRQM